MRVVLLLQLLVALVVALVVIAIVAAVVVVVLSVAFAMCISVSHFALDFEFFVNTLIPFFYFLFSILFLF